MYYNVPYYLLEMASLTEVVQRRPPPPRRLNRPRIMKVHKIGQFL